MKKTYIIYLLAATFAACTNGGKNNEQFISKADSAKFESNRLLTAEDIYNLSINKVAMIVSYKDGVPLSQGSGFFIDKNILVTNFHCVAGSNNIEFKIAGNEKIYKGAKVVKASDDYDLAIIKTKQDFPFIKIDSLGNEKVGSKVYAIGNPRGLEGTISDGILSGKRDNEGVEYLQITAPISPGNSGGPVLNETGHVIGVSTFTYRNSQNLNFAMPIKYIKECNDYTPEMTKSKARKIGTSSDALSLTYFEKNGSEFYEFLTLKNNTDCDIISVTGVIIYKTMSGEILDYQTFTRKVDIPVGLAKRIELRSFDQSQNWKYYKSSGGFNDKSFKIEFRLLSYELDEF